MLKDRVLQISMAKAPTTATMKTGDDEKVVLDPVAINALAMTQVQNLAICIGAVLLSKKLVDTVCELAVVYSNTQGRIAIDAASHALWSVKD